VADPTGALSRVDTDANEGRAATRAKNLEQASVLIIALLRTILVQQLIALLRTILVQQLIAMPLPKQICFFSLDITPSCQELSGKRIL
jgi:hypothetical protein